MSKIKSNSVKKILDEISILSKIKKYFQFYEQLIKSKEGLYQDFENRDTLIELVRFKTTKSDDVISFKDYVKKYEKNQDTIYFIAQQIRKH